VKYAASYWKATRPHGERSDNPPRLPAPYSSFIIPRTHPSSTPQTQVTATIVYRRLAIGYSAALNKKQLNAVKINGRERTVSHFKFSLTLSMPSAHEPWIIRPLKSPYSCESANDSPSPGGEGWDEGERSLFPQGLEFTGAMVHGRDARQKTEYSLLTRTEPVRGKLRQNVAGNKLRERAENRQLMGKKAKQPFATMVVGTANLLFHTEDMRAKRSQKELKIKFCEHAAAHFKFSLQPSPGSWPPKFIEASRSRQRLATDFATKLFEEFCRKMKFVTDSANPKKIACLTNSDSHDQIIGLTPPEWFCRFGVPAFSRCDVRRRPGAIYRDQSPQAVGRISLSGRGSS